MKRGWPAAIVLLGFFLLANPLSLPLQPRLAIQKVVSSGESPLPFEGVPKGVTYGFSGGRLGDNLLAFARAQWVALRLGVPLWIRPFPFSDQLSLSCLYPTLEIPPEACQTLDPSVRRVDPDKILLIPYFPDSHYEYRKGNRRDLPFFEIDWEDPAFKRAFSEALSPLHRPLPQLVKPPGTLTVALHVRRGGAVDDLAACQRDFPLKFPSLNYYAAQLEAVRALFPTLPIAVHLFTDDLDPEALAATLRARVEPLDLSIAPYPGELFDHFYAIGQCDCVISSQSNFARIAARRGEPLMTIAPTSANRKKEVDEVEIALR